MKKIVGKHVIIGAITTLACFAVTAHADIVGNAKAGQDKVAMCIGCHGIPDYRTAYPEVYHVPILGGQKGDRHFETMHAIAASLTEQDIADIAAYYASRTAASKDNPEK
jgi:cytochrome c553